MTINFTYIQGIPGAHDTSEGRKVAKKHTKSKINLRNRREYAKVTLQRIAMRYKEAKKAEKRRSKTKAKARKPKAGTDQLRKRATKVYNYTTELTKKYAQGIRSGKLMAKPCAEEEEIAGKPTSKSIKFCGAKYMGTHKKRKAKRRV